MKPAQGRVGGGSKICKNREMKWVAHTVLLVALTLTFVDSVLAGPRQEKWIESLISSYYPNLSTLVVAKKMNKQFLKGKLKNLEEDGSHRLKYTTPRGMVFFWLNKKGVVTSVRLKFKVNEKSISRGEVSLLKKYRGKIVSTKYLRSPHSRLSQIIDKKENMGLSVLTPNSDIGVPRVVGLFLNKGFFR